MGLNGEREFVARLGFSEAMRLDFEVNDSNSHWIPMMSGVERRPPCYK